MSAFPQVYTPLKYSQIRILRLHGDCGNARSQLVADLCITDFLHPQIGLGVHDLNENEYPTKHAALSYTWGDEDQPRHHIYLNGLAFEIRENLHQALLELRPQGRQYLHLWVDALCIDQSNKAEQAIQIASRMVQIYETTEQVIAWLGLMTPEIAFLARPTSSTVAVENYK